MMPMSMRIAIPVLVTTLCLAASSASAGDCTRNLRQFLQERTKEAEQTNLYRRTVLVQRMTSGPKKKTVVDTMTIVSGGRRSSTTSKKIDMVADETCTIVVDHDGKNILIVDADKKRAKLPSFEDGLADMLKDMRMKTCEKDAKGMEHAVFERTNAPKDAVTMFDIRYSMKPLSCTELTMHRGTGDAQAMSQFQVLEESTSTSLPKELRGAALSAVYDASGAVRAAYRSYRVTDLRSGRKKTR
ncbi:MAG: hypothetical protein J0I17_13375 ['Candidatus Kapabacteria' thiocyanatum]|nr:hypothetical protein ['Candidatus Kapabacteria' thiocyanatum]